MVSLVTSLTSVCSLFCQRHLYSHLNWSVEPSPSVTHGLYSRTGLQQKSSTCDVTCTRSGLVVVWLPCHQLNVLSMSRLMMGHQVLPVSSTFERVVYMWCSTTVACPDVNWDTMDWWCWNDFLPAVRDQTAVKVDHDTFWRPSSCNFWGLYRLQDSTVYGHSLMLHNGIGKKRKVQLFLPWSDSVFSVVPIHPVHSPHTLVTLSDQFGSRDLNIFSSLSCCMASTVRQTQNITCCSLPSLTTTCVQCVRERVTPDIHILLSLRLL